LMYLKLKVCSWDDCGATLALLPEKIKSGEKIITPFPLLSLIDDPCLHQQCAQIFTQEKYPVNLALGPIAKRAKSSKIRLGYFSADFGNHPVSLLTAELFELHDRNQFEVIAFSFGPDDQSTMRSRLQNTFDQFIDVTELSDQAVASLARDHKIDIAVDLGGHTKGARTGIFAYRAAPIQVNYLGYPGTLGADFMDYVIADSTIIPLEHQAFYSEAIVHLPHSYMVDDSKRIPSNKNFSRADFALPDEAMVFCCFNNDYKFNQGVLESWSRILLAVENSVLWIHDNSELFKQNLTKEFEKLNISSSRIIFSPKVELMSDHLARYALADLFLDTFPYNAHTTAADSLKAGVPVLTILGEAFAGRVAASLLNALDLNELVTTSQKEYESLAIELAASPEKLISIKERLKLHLLSKPLFNSRLFTRDIESIYLRMMERHWAGLAPDHIQARPSDPKNIVF
jgi:predicted O-linked N-acetylglucosamine transferase (SPINDLY family)